MEYTSFHHAAWNPLHLNGMHFTTLHGLHFIQSQCMESTAFYRDAFGHAAYNPLHLIGMLWAMLHKIHCIQSCCMDSPAFNRDALDHAAKKSTAFNRDALGLASWTPVHTVGIHCTTMHGMLCIQCRCMESTAFNRDALGHAA